MSLVAQRRLVGSAATGFETLWCRVVLDNVVVPVRYPEGAIRADFSVNGRRPPVVTGQEVSRIVRGEVGSVAVEEEQA